MRKHQLQWQLNMANASEKLPKIAVMTRRTIKTYNKWNKNAREKKSSTTMWQRNNKIVENGICFPLFIESIRKVWCVCSWSVCWKRSLNRTFIEYQMFCRLQRLLDSYLPFFFMIFFRSPKKSENILIFRCWRMWFIDNSILKRLPTYAYLERDCH